MKFSKRLSLCLAIFIVFASLAQNLNSKDSKKNVDLPLSNDFVDFKKIKGILKKDGLEKIVTKKKENHKVLKQVKNDKVKKQYQLPDENDLWEMISEYWLIKNNAVLKWSFHKPDYGLREYFEEFLKEVGELGINYRILYLNTSNVSHMGLPLGDNEYLFLLSVPFLKALDLSKLQISILMYEDLLRLKNNFFKNKFSVSNIKKVSDGNFYKKEYPKENWKNIIKKMDSIIFEKGFTFKEQYQVTKSMNIILKNNKKFWSNYYALLEKIDELSKNNLAYKEYAKIYPSPELQLNWINPIKK